MYNTKQINRVRRILSANEGAQVPDYNINNFAPNNMTPPPTTKEDYIQRRIADLSNLSSEELEERKVQINKDADYFYGSDTEDTSGTQPNPSASNGKKSSNTKNPVDQAATLLTSPGMGKQVAPRALTPKERQEKQKKQQQKAGNSNATGGSLASNFFGSMKDSVKDYFKDFNLEKAGNLAAGVSNSIALADTLFVDKSKFAADSFANSKASQYLDMAANKLQQFGSIGKIGAAAIQLGQFAGNMITNTTNQFAADQATLNQVGGSYGGSVANINDAASKANQTYGLWDFGKVGKINNQIAEAQRQQSIMQDIAADSQDIQGLQAFASDVGGLAYQFNMNGGYDQRYLRASKEGGILDFDADFTEATRYTLSGGNIESFKEGGNVNSFRVVLSDIMESFKEGGSLKAPEIEVIETDTNQKSVIPEGTLHKNKHHLADVGVDDSELTKKGIPVVDNSGEQQAEIELNEIIFTLEVTKELESRYKEFYEEDTSPSKKDELALEAGKLLWKEILYNTDDRTGLIDTLKKGGAIKAKDGTKAPKKEEKKTPFEEWVKDINKGYLNPNYDLELAYEYLPIEDLERWKHAVNSADPEVYLSYKDPKTGEYTYHLKSIAPYGEDEYIFLKKGTETTNPEVGSETSLYWSGENGLKETHDLVYDQKEGRYFYRKKKAQKHELGGNITQESITEMVRQALINILNHG